mmetsp:Transcript_6976/g.10906  ORF Transcript_6976/g.10906 Transcript_6976/m.10906 type:complete len:242 (-) Transcript_6976:108-833(-)
MEGRRCHDQITHRRNDTTPAGGGLRSEHEKAQCKGPSRSYGVSVLCTTFQPDSVVMDQVSDLFVFGHLQHGFEVAADRHLVRLVGRAPGPQRDAMLLPAHRDDGAADLAGLAELLADHGEEHVEPVLVQSLHLLALGEAVRPLAALGALGVLPLGLDTLLEQVKVGAHDQPAGRQDVVVQAPEILHRVEGVHATQRLPPGHLLLLPVGVVEPKSPCVLQRVLLGEVWRGGSLSGHGFFLPA